jgi:uncharacterized protein DUF1905
MLVETGLPIDGRSGQTGQHRPPYPDRVWFEFDGEVWFWKGPSPFHFVTIPEAECREIKAASSAISYGWGVIPVTVRLGETEFTTSLFPKDGRYLVPIKDAVRLAEGVELGDEVTLRVSIDV